MLLAASLVCTAWGLVSVLLVLLFLLEARVPGLFNGRFLEAKALSSPLSVMLVVAIGAGDVGEVAG